MSSRHLTSSDLNMLGRLLGSARQHPRDEERETAAAKFLLSLFLAGETEEATLRAALASSEMRLTIEKQMHNFREGMSGTVH
ncbi:MAG: hypothetical protein KF694_19100 [Mesorhizobium sp.]|nr:hypothetical protein [Mesorhizobium sp.]